MKFQTHLDSLSRGRRNTELVPLMLRGLGEKMSPQDIINAIHLAHPDLGDGELRHAMESACKLKTDRILTIGELKIRRAVKIAEIVNKEDRDFVENTIAKCSSATSADIMQMSPIDVSEATPREQALAYIATVFPDDRHMVFTATEESKFHKRTFDTLKFPSYLFRQIADGADIPNYAIANQFTGKPDDYSAAVSGNDFDTFEFTGKSSFACMKTLATRRLALLEFDNLPLDEQARFWAAAIEENIFGDRLRTLVFSGTKSIHALIRVDSAEIIDYTENEFGDYKAVWSDDPQAKWKAEREKLSRKTEHAEDEKYHADKACKDPTRLTRFAGAVRLCKDGKRRVQRLLWCAEPTDRDIPSFDGNGVFYTEGFGLNGEYYKC